MLKDDERSQEIVEEIVNEKQLVLDVKPYADDFNRIAGIIDGSALDYFFTKIDIFMKNAG